MELSIDKGIAISNLWRKAMSKKKTILNDLRNLMQTATLPLTTESKEKINALLKQLHEATV